MPINPDKIDYSKGLPKRLFPFEIIEDPRTGGNTRHHFGEVLFMVVSAMLCGMNTFLEIESFCKYQSKWLRNWITMPHGVPRAQTFSNIFQIIDNKLFNQCLANHVQTLLPDIQQQIIAIDGKKLRGSGCKTEELDASHAVSAWAADSGVTLGQEFVDDKSNEITAIPKLLGMLSIRGHIVTIDAMGTQTAIADRIIEKKADYILAVKGNQKALHDEVIYQFDFASKQLDLNKLGSHWSVDVQKDKSHGKVVIRKVVATTYLDWMSPGTRERWSNIESIVMVETETFKSEEEPPARHVRYYISSLKADASEFQNHIRTHWSIENQCHWVLDTAFREDHHQCYKKQAARNLGATRRIVLNMLKTDDSRKESIPQKRFSALMDIDFRERLLSL
jgi:predicted transposase YbfD/YdcC